MYGLSFLCKWMVAEEKTPRQYLECWTCPVGLARATLTLWRLRKQLSYIHAHRLLDIS
jgi:hypothetical protein